MRLIFRGINRIFLTSQSKGDCDKKLSFSWFVLVLFYAIQHEKVALYIIRWTIKTSPSFFIKYIKKLVSISSHLPKPPYYHSLIKQNRRNVMLKGSELINIFFVRFFVRFLSDLLSDFFVPSFVRCVVRFLSDFCSIFCPIFLPDFFLIFCPIFCPIFLSHVLSDFLSDFFPICGPFFLTFCSIFVLSDFSSDAFVRSFVWFFVLFFFLTFRPIFFSRCFCPIFCSDLGVVGLVQTSSFSLKRTKL